MNIPEVHNLTRYNTEDLTEIVRRTYLLLAAVGWNGQSRTKQIQFREHKSDRARNYYDSAMQKNVITKPYVGMMNRNRFYQVRLIAPEVLHGNDLAVLAHVSSETLALPQEAVVMIMRHIMDYIEHRSAHRTTLPTIIEASTTLQLRYTFGKRPKTPKAVSDFEREFTEKEVWEALRNEGWKVRYRLQSIRHRTKKMQERYKRLKVAPVDPNLIDRLNLVSAELHMIIQRIIDSKEVIR